MIQQIIRIEHKDGYGLFYGMMNGQPRKHTAYDLCKPLFNRHNKFNDPFEDSIRKFTRNHFCGYRSIRQLQKWVLKDEFKILFDNDYKVLLLEVSDCLKGKQQIAYRKEDVVNSKDISELFV